MQKILCIGHSHMNALRGVGSPDNDLDFLYCMEEQADGSVRYRAPGEFAEVDGGPYARVCLFIRASRHIVLGLVNHPGGPFDFHLPEQPQLPLVADATLYPYGLLKAILQRHMRQDFADLAVFHAQFRQRPLYVIEPPAPSPRDHVLRHPAGFAQAIAQHGLAPDRLRYKFWRLHTQLLREYCARSGMRFVPVPPQSVDQDGMLRQQFCRDDPTHGNLLYGKLMIQQLHALNETEAGA
ncbi:hypothetical protein ACEN9F_11795 [Duganella sp. CT11-25]|jgi:hypothetical protein|uniref:hypothetical protein n=1 Tax=unclassified Duganella TaxID=2636909 RepID=UPI0039AEE4B7